MNKNKEVEGVREDIDEMIGDLDPGVRNRWFRYKPKSNSSKNTANYSPISSPAKKNNKNNKKPKHTTHDENEENYLSDSDSSIEVLAPPKKKKKRTTTDTNDSGDDEAVEMSFYLYVETPAPPVLNVRKGSTKALPPQRTELGPFIFMSSINYTDFLHIISTGCRTKTANLALSSVQWKFDRPANATKKSLSNEAAYKVMMKSIKERRKDYVFSVYMAPPTAVKQELPWTKDEDDGNGGGPSLDFKYNLDAPSASVLSIREQITSIDNASNTEMNELLEAYPIDNNPLFPGKRIYHNETGYFDLTDIKLRVWAIAKAKGTATIDKPPASNHFFKNQTIRPAHPSGLPAPAPTPAPATAPAAASSNDLLQLLLGNPNVLHQAAQLFNPNQHLFPGAYPYMPPFSAPPHPFGAHPPAPPQAPQVAEPLSIKLPRGIVLEEYFERYNVNMEDRRVLTELGYIPGDDGITDLDDKSWEATKVLPLAKGRILRQHGAFLKDVVNGLWE
ncbi:hypothetical protein B0H11DRAFT_2358896 [Mycena galericulata]|nr:hypothetical protein B0H11DRAFT_2358896 [Mycena galericulata]